MLLFDLIILSFFFIMMLQQEDKFEADTTTNNWYYLEKNNFYNTIDTAVPYSDNIYISIPTENLPVVKPTKRSEKRFRTKFTGHQILTLEESFQQSNYVSKISRTMLANDLHLCEKKIKIWFQNRRMRKKKEERSLKSKIAQVTNCSSIEDQHLHTVAQIPQQGSPKQVHSLSNNQTFEDVKQYGPIALNTQLRPNQLSEDLKNSMNANSPLTYSSSCSTGEKGIFEESKPNLLSEVLSLTNFSPNLDGYKQQYPQVNNSYSHNLGNYINSDFEQFSEKPPTYSATYTEILQNGEYYNFCIDYNPY